MKFPATLLYQIRICSHLIVCTVRFCRQCDSVASLAERRYKSRVQGPRL